MSLPAVPVFALCDSMSAAVPLALGIALTRPELGATFRTYLQGLSL